MQNVAKTKRKADRIDFEVSRNIKGVRLAARMTMKDAAGLLGISYQQYAKYESGENRITAGTLYKLSTMFKADIESFFSGEVLRYQAGRNGSVFMYPVQSKETTRLIQAFEDIKSQDVRDRLFELAKTLAADGHE